MPSYELMTVWILGLGILYFLKELAISAARIVDGLTRLLRELQRDRHF